MGDVRRDVRGAFRLGYFTTRLQESLPLPSYRRPLLGTGLCGALTSIWGYHGDHAPHGDTFWQLRRRVPVVTVVVDTPQRSREWFRIIDEVTDETGLVTSEIVPAHRAAGAVASGGLRLADRLP